MNQTFVDFGIIVVVIFISFKLIVNDLKPVIDAIVKLIKRNTIQEEKSSVPYEEIRIFFLSKFKKTRLIEN